MYVVTTEETVTNASRYGNAACVCRLMNQPMTTRKRDAAADRERVRL